MNKTRKSPRIHIHDLDYHRNRIGGAPFHVFLFDNCDDENTRKLGILFDAPHHGAMLDVAKLASRSIGFGFNSCLGDHFESSLRAALRFPR